MTYQSKQESKDTDLLFDAILTLASKEDCYRFFEDVSTVNELRSLAQRFHIAKLLSENHTYQDIEKETGASTATISRVGRCLHYGADGYQRALQKLRER
jgi:TrpR-related protein YerC/YecD